MTQPPPHRWRLTSTALFRASMPPVFLHPRHWLEGCWPCASRSPQQQQLMEAEARKIERRKRVFKYPPGPSLAELRDAMAAAHPDHGGTAEAFRAAHTRWRDAMKRAHGHAGWVNQAEIEAGQHAVGTLG